MIKMIENKTLEKEVDEEEVVKAGTLAMEVASGVD